MNVRYIMKLAACITILYIGSIAFGQDNSPDLKLKGSRPNVVFFLVDDLGWQDVGYMGSAYYETPAIDALAASSFRFSHAYSSSANCAPSRAALMSGQYSPRTGIYTVGKATRGPSEQRKLVPVENETVLANSVVTMAEALASRGYRTGFFGKWHLGKDKQGGPLAQGFEVNVGGNHRGRPTKGYFAPWGNPDMPPAPDGTYLTEFLTEQAVSFVGKQTKDQPFFLMMSLYSVHTPIQAPEATVARFRGKKGDQYHNNPTYAAMVSHTDESLRRILAALRRQDMDRDTIVVFTSDNGGYGPVTQAPNLRGSKGTPYEGGTRVPSFVYVPGAAETGMDIETPISSIDFYPTMVELAEGSVAAETPLDGESLLPLLGEAGQWDRKAIHFHFPAYLEPYGKGREFRSKPYGAVRMGDYKLIEFFEHGQLELYDLVRDPAETRNLALERPDVTLQLLSTMRAWRKETDAFIPEEFNPEFDEQYKPTEFITEDDVEAALGQQKLLHGAAMSGTFENQERSR